jgi:GntR family transcriptional regulator
MYHPAMAALPIQIDRTSPVPLYHQLAEQLTAAISGGTLLPGDPFENELAMADRLGLSRPTVRRAIAELVNKGLLVRRRGIGTTVANQMVHRRAELTSLYDDLMREGRKPRTDVLSLVCDAKDDRAAEALGLPPGTPLVAIVRLRYAGDMPLAIMRNWLPPALEDLTVAQLEEDGLYAVLRARGIRPTVARQRIGARNATAEERRTLHMSKAEPLVTMTRSAYDADGSPVEFGDHCYRADQYSVEVMVSER